MNSTDMKNLQRKDVTVELLRVIAILMVIGTHIKLPMNVGDSIGKARVLISCLVGDGVAIFWMILGFFYFRSSYKKHVCRLVSRIVLPLFICSAIGFFFYDFLIGANNSIVDSMSHTAEEYKLLLRSLLKWENGVNGASHFWYLYVYVMVILIFPALKGIREYILNAKYGDIKALIVFFSALVINDIVNNELFEFSHHTFRGALAASIFVLTGDILYRNLNRYNGKKKLSLVAFIILCCAVCGRAYIQYAFLKREPPSQEPLFWFTSYAFASVVSLIVFIYGLSSLWNKSRILSKVLSYLGSRTFYIYLVHMVFVNSTFINPLKLKVLDFFGVGSIGTLGYQIVVTLMMFSLSLITVEFIIQIARIIKKLFCRKLHRKI